MGQKAKVHGGRETDTQIETDSQLDRERNIQKERSTEIQTHRQTVSLLSLKLN